MRLEPVNRRTREPVNLTQPMELSELQVFLTVAGERSFSRAAAKLHRTQPAVSQAIRRLEEELGERLFDRSSKQGALDRGGPRAARVRAAPDAPERGSRSRRARIARPAARTRPGRRQRGRRACAAPAGRPLPSGPSRDPGGRPPRPLAPGRRRGRAGQSRFRRDHLSSGRTRPAHACRSAPTTW